MVNSTGLRATPALCATLLLVTETDICRSTLTCPPRLVERLHASGCASGPGIPLALVRRLREMFGTIKRTYIALLEQHPSLPMSLEALLRDTEGVSTSATASAGWAVASPSIDVVVLRCKRTSLSPLFRALPALLGAGRGSAGTHGVPPTGVLRLFVYERCAAVAASYGARPQPFLPESLLPFAELDVRDQLFEVRRLRLDWAAAGTAADAGRGGGRGSHAVRAFRAHAAAAARGAFAPAAHTLLLSWRGLARLSVGDPYLTAGDRRVDWPASLWPPMNISPDSSPLGGIDDVMRALRRRYVQSDGAEPWTSAATEAAAAARQLGAAIGAAGGGAAEGSPTGAVPAGGAASGEVGTREGHGDEAPVEVMGCNNETLAWLISPAALSAAARGMRPSRRLAPTGCQGHHSWSLGRNGGSEAGGGSSGGGSISDGGGRPSVNVDGIVLSSWPGNASLPGFCGVTNDGVEGSCTRGVQGSWGVRVHRVSSFADCAARCYLCQRCRFVTYAPSEDDCSWYNRCDLRRLGAMPGFYSMEVVRPAGGSGAAQAGGAAVGGPGLLVDRDYREELAMEAVAAYTGRVAGDRALHGLMLSGALRQLVGAGARMLVADRGSGEGGDARAGGGETAAGGAGSGAGAGGAAAAARHSGAGGGSPAAAWRGASGGRSAGDGGTGSGGGSTGGSSLVLSFDCVEPDFVLHNRRLLPTRHQLAACSGWRGGAGTEGRATAAAQRGVGGGAAGVSSFDARRRLRSRLASLRRAAESASCQPGTTVQKDLHLSGFFSMLSSTIKPWTAAIRLHLALQTPLAAGLLSPARCARRPVDLGCFFVPVGPACETGAGRRAPDLRLNLAQLRRESPLTHDGAAIPEPFRQLGAFWWVSSLLAELTQPNAELAARLDAAAAESGLAAALANGEVVVGMHVRHGDSCSAAEAVRTCRTCDPLETYLQAIGSYAAFVGASAVFLATDSADVVAAARAAERSMAGAAANGAADGVGNAQAGGGAPYGGARVRFLVVHSNVSRYSTRAGAPPPELLDLVLKRRAGGNDVAGMAASHEAALAGLVDAMLLARTAILVGKFSSGMFRTAYALAAARAGGLPPYLSLDAPWCADYGLPAAFNDDFPQGRHQADGARREAEAEQVVIQTQAGGATSSRGGGKAGQARGIVRKARENVCSC